MVAMATLVGGTVAASGAILLADFFSGLVHWAEDAYARKNTPVIGKWIGEANIEHHKKPRAFVSRSYWASSWDLWLAAGLVVLGAWYWDLLSWPVWVFALVAANANQVHKWAHSAPHENGPIVTALQRLRLIQTQSHHRQHHSGEKNSHYCSITNVLNPVLERIGLWSRLERLLAFTIGMKRKPEAQN